MLSRCFLPDPPPGRPRPSGVRELASAFPSGACSADRDRKWLATSNDRGASSAAQSGSKLPHSKGRTARRMPLSILEWAARHLRTGDRGHQGRADRGDSKSRGPHSRKSVLTQSRIPDPLQDRARLGPRRSDRGRTDPSENRSHSGCRKRSQSGCRKRSHLSSGTNPLLTPDARSNPFLTRNEPISGARRGTKPLFPRIEPILEVGRRIEPILAAGSNPFRPPEQTHPRRRNRPILGGRAPERTHSFGESKPISAAGRTVMTLEMVTHENGRGRACVIAAVSPHRFSEQTPKSRGTPRRGGEACREFESLRGRPDRL